MLKNPFMLYKFVYLANFKDTTNLIVAASDDLSPEQEKQMDSTV